MEVFQMNSNVKITKCPECEETSLFRIDQDNLNLTSKCKNGHIKNIEFNNFENSCLKNTTLFLNFCSNCFCVLNEKFNNYICITCNKLLCNNCINYHMKKEEHFNANIYINRYAICHLHNLKYKLFCENCKINICEECATQFHKDHIIKSIVGIIPNKKEKELMKVKIHENRKKIENLVNYIKKIKKEIEERYNKLKNYLSFLTDINNKLLGKFNFSYYDYYIYDNYNYFYKYIDNEENMKKEKLLDYLFFNKSLKINETKAQSLIEKNPIYIQEQSLIELEKKSKIIFNDFSKIENMKNLNYFKDNLFISFEQKINNYTNITKTIYLYEYKNCFFRLINNYSYTSSTKIDFLKISKYSNFILVNCKNFKIIKIFEYNISEKSIVSTNKEIRGLKVYGQNFIDFIDNKNGNIITTDSKELIVWKKSDKNIRYNKVLNITGNYIRLYNLNDSLFLCKNNNNLTFFETEKYTKIKTFNFNTDIIYLGIINNKIFIFMDKVHENIFIMDLKYLEIVQTINYEKNKLKDILLLNEYILNISFDYNSNKIIIEKKKFDFKEGYFKEEEIIKKQMDKFDYSRILKADNYSIAFMNEYQITIFQI